MRTALASVSARMRGDFERYCRQEDGALAFFIILIFFLMMVFGGIAVDVMRFETRRVAMQQTMDRAVLAAASLNQSVDGQAVVDDYFAKADLGSGLGMVEFGTPTVTKSDPTDSSYRRVSINSTVRSYNFFMGMGFMPVEYLQSPVVSTAEQGVDKVEVILVLDVSGSMTNNGKLDALKVAAKNFVDTVKDADDKNQISIGIVPYQGQVNLGQALREQYTAAYLPPFGGVSDAGIPDVNCLEIPDSLFDASALSRTEPFPMAALADTRSAQGSQTPVDDEQQRICNPETDNTVLLPTKSKTELNAKIDSLTGSGYTSIMLGMRWGAALIDSDANAIYKALLPAEMHDRPAVKGSIPFTDKIIVLMTDGKHQSIPYVVDEYKEGTSPIYLVSETTTVATQKKRSNGTWRSPTTTSSSRTIYTINFPDASKRPTAAGSNAFYSQATNAWQAAAALPESSTVTNPDSSTRVTTKITQTATVLDWSEVWYKLRVSWVAKELYADSQVTGAERDTMMNEFMDVFMGDPAQSTFTVNSSGVPNVDRAVHNTYKDELLKETCSKTRAESVTIFGIAFTAPAEGQAAISNCASLPTSEHYFFIDEAQTDEEIAEELNTAFQLIAAEVGSLRLTQ